MRDPEKELGILLGKKWLSTNAVRDGMIMSAILTMARAAERRPGAAIPGGEQERLSRTAFDAARDVFRELNVDYEYPPAEALPAVRERLDTRLGFGLGSVEPEDRRTHDQTCQKLLAKLQDEH